MTFEFATLRQFLADVRQWIWPTMGWRRFIRLQFLKLSRLSGGEKVISRGFACGAAISFTPFVGLHFVISGVLAKCIHANVISAMIGTVVGNPWTFPFIWSFTYSLGRWILDVKDHGEQLDDDLSLATLITNPLDIFLPMLIGSVPFMLVVWPLAYFGCYHMIYWRKRMKLKQKL